jgi:hypothetical protein
VNPFKVPEPNLQLTFYHRLIEVRETYLLDALLSLVVELDIAQLDRDLSAFVSNTALQRVAGWGLRGEGRPLSWAPSADAVAGRSFLQSRMS